MSGKKACIRGFGDAGLRARGFGDALYRGFGDALYRGFGALYIYRFEIMILLRVNAKSLLCYWAVKDLGIGTVNMEM
jgi:hypothetical protein